jgi:phage-related protein
MEWRTLMTAMPAQLKQVATAMGYVDADSLGEALREGNVSMDEFMNTIVKLNSEGLPGFQNFEEQARNSTGGVRTAITNMNSRITQGVTAMIESVDKGLKDAKLGGIAKVFETIGNTVRDTLKGLAPYIVKTVSFLVNLAKWINENKTWLEAIIIPLVAFIGTFSMIMKIISIVKGITTAISVLNAVMLANPIVLIIAAIVALIAIFVVLWKKCDWFRNFWIGLWNGIVEIVVGAWEWIKGLFTGIIDFISNNWQALLLFLVNPFAGAFKLLYDNCEGFRNFVNGFVNAVVGFFKSIPGKLVSFAQGIVNVFTSIPGKMMNVGKNIAQGLWNGISGLKDWVINKVKNMGKSILNAIKNVLGIHSPSTEFAMIGKFSVLGYTEELDKMTKTVQGQIAETFSVSPQLANSSSLHYSPNVVVNTVNNISQDPLGRMVNDIKTFSGGAKNDYNYGMGVS